MWTSGRVGALVMLSVAMALTACEGDKGAAGSSCTASQNASTGEVTLSCDDGTTVTFPAGTMCTVTRDDAGGTTTIDCDGDTSTIPDGTGCTVADNGNGTQTVTCDDGTSGVIDNRQDLAELVVNIETADPANGMYFEAGEQIVITITLTDTLDQPVFLGDLARAGLYMYGPQDVLLAETANALLDASLDREAEDRQHHYINLKTTTNDNLVVNGNVLTYTLEAITDEDPGTYSIGVWAVTEADSLNQVFPVHNVQIGTANEEADIVGNCADCHQAENGKLYLHHIDQGSSHMGNPAIDSAPPRTCKMCHNLEGYAAFRECSDGTRPPCEGGATEERVPDPLVRRVHGVHFGSGLTTEFNINEDGDFHDYSEVHFPADPRNCTKCHLDDSWRMQPSRMTCGACHDRVNFEEGTLDPPRQAGECTSDLDCDTNYSCNLTSGYCERALHGGGDRTTDDECVVCHTATPGDGISPIPDRHAIPRDESQYTLTLSLSPPTGGAAFYTDESPVLTIRVTDSGGTPYDPTTWLEDTFYRAQLFVSGPREHTEPVLTTAAALPRDAGNSSYAQNDLRDLGVAGPTDDDPKIARTATEIQYALDSVAGLEPGTYHVFSRIRPTRADEYAWDLLRFQVGTADEEPKVATNCTNCHADTTMHGAFPFEPDICKNCHDYKNQIVPSEPDCWQASGCSQQGFGAGPLSRRIHGVHRGHYLDHPEEIHSRYDYSYLIFPHDIRSCTTCHSESDSWMEEPSRLACLACHDSDANVTHGDIMSIDPTMMDPYSGDESESCGTCHGPGQEYAVDEAHNITDPYVPPYFR